VEPTNDKPWSRPWPKEGPPPLLALSLTESLQARLREVREQQMAEHRAGWPALVCGVFYEQEVVWLRAGGGHATYLGTDGRVYYENYAEGKDCVVLTDPRAIASAVVRWAAEIGVPELVEQLPPPPAGGEVCRLCGGSRWESPASTGDPDGQPWCCRRCKGLGWTMAEPDSE
jgi:hypothetical protein